MTDAQLLKLFLWGASALASWVAGLFFLRFWRETRDRFFVLFAAAFWVLAADWVALALVNPTDETRHLFYLARLLAFGLILVAIVDKNRRARG
jgi:hypothetical protein